MRRVATIAAFVLLALALPLAGSGADSFPERIDLPDGWQPEGIAIGRGNSVYAGSRATGAVWKGDLRTGEGAVLVEAQAGRQATGLMVDRRGRLFVSGAATGQAYVYDAETGEQIALLQLAEPMTPTFVNDVVVTRDAAWFTDSRQPVLYRIPIGRGGALGTPETIELSGDYEHLPPPAFNLNGIDATPNGRTLIVVQSTTGKLFTVSTDGVTEEIDLGGILVTAGDGILLDGRTLYVVRNTFNEIVEIRLSRDRTSGTVVDTITHPDFDVPTTIDEHGNRLYAVNARFSTPPTADTKYWITQVRK
jgi:sugar lactone lactonase YvrE